MSMPKASCGFDGLEWHKVQCLIKEICAQSNLTITVCDQSIDEQSQKQDKESVRSALGQEQSQDEAVSKFIQWIERRKEPTSQDLQGLPRLAWQLNNQLKSLQFLDGSLCRKFETGNNEMLLRQIIPPSMTHEVLSACLSSSTAGHLGVAKTSEKKNKGSTGQDCTKTQNYLSAGAQNVRNVRGRPRNIIIHWWNGKPVILFTTLESISWGLCFCQMETNTS